MLACRISIENGPPKNADGDPEFLADLKSVKNVMHTHWKNIHFKEIRRAEGPGRFRAPTVPQSNQISDLDLVSEF